MFNRLTGSAGPFEEVPFRDGKFPWGKKVPAPVSFPILLIFGFSVHDHRAEQRYNFPIWILNLLSEL